MIYDEKNIGTKEAYSLIVQATVGCSYNKCSFCSEYKDEDFRIRDFKEIIEDLAIAREKYENINKIVISDGDPLVMGTKDLVKVLKSIEILFPENREVLISASPQAVLEKTIDELIELKKAGLDVVYMGLDTGSDRVLYDIDKGVNKEELVLAGRKIKHAELGLYTRVLVGIGGIRFSEDHANDTARILNRINPDVIDIEDVILDEDIPMYEHATGEDMRPLTPKESLREMKAIIEKLKIDDTVVKGKHISGNHVFYGVLPKDKGDLLDEIDRDITEIEFTNNKNKRI